MKHHGSCKKYTKSPTEVLRCQICKELYEIAVCSETSKARNGREDTFCSKECAQIYASKHKNLIKSNICKRSPGHE